MKKQYMDKNTFSAARTSRSVVQKWCVCFVLIFTLSLMVGCAAIENPESDSNNNDEDRQDRTIFAMDTLITQVAYGENAGQAMDAVNEAFAAYEKKLSLFEKDSDVYRLNEAAGEDWVDVDSGTYALLEQARTLSDESDGAFALTIAPLTLAWGITGDSARVPPEDEIGKLVALVDDDALLLEDGKVMLASKGMGIDLGGIAKGAACALAADVYKEYDVTNALLSIGGNVYARGTKPDGSQWQVGFRDPLGEGYLASFPLEDNVIAVSGGYERYSEIDGEKYIHILDPKTGYPAQSDIVSVGVVDPDGAVADFYSTTLFVWGLEKSLEYIRAGGNAIVLDGENNLYVSEGLADGFKVYDEVKEKYKLIIVAKEAE